MVMEDRLKKSRCSAFKYYFKRCSLFISIFIGTTAAITIPLSIVSNIKQAEDLKNEDKDDSESETKIDDENKESLLVF